MPREVVKAVSAPAPVGAYSQAVKAGGLVFVSGQIPIKPESGEMVTGDMRAAAAQCLDNAAAVLADAGLTLDDVVATTVFLTDMGNFAAVNDVYSERFGDAPPARAVVEVSSLPKGAEIEILVTAYAG